MIITLPTVFPPILMSLHLRSQESFSPAQGCPDWPSHSHKQKHMHSSDLQYLPLSSPTSSLSSSPSPSPCSDWRFVYLAIIISSFGQNYPVPPCWAYKALGNALGRGKDEEIPKRDGNLVDFFYCRCDRQRMWPQLDSKY